jgi:hypothetical protein
MFMKKTLVYALTIIALVAMVFGTVTPAFAAEAQTATFTGFQYVYGKGSVFNFDVTGTFSSAELHGTVTTSDGTVHPLYCVQMKDDATRVNCNTTRNIYGTVTVAFASFVFTVETTMDSCSLYLMSFLNPDIGTWGIIISRPGDVDYWVWYVETYEPGWIYQGATCISDHNIPEPAIYDSDNSF